MSVDFFLPSNSNENFYKFVTRIRLSLIQKFVKTGFEFLNEELVKGYICFRVG